MRTIDEIFGSDGLLVQHRRVHRPGQLSLAKQIDHCLSFGLHGLMEGATGVGKTFAYLVPAVLAALRGQRVLVAVCNNALLEQVLRDFPVLLDMLGISIRYVGLKGRKNYVCPYRSDKFHLELIHDDKLRLERLRTHNTSRLMEFVRDGGVDLTKHSEAISKELHKKVTIERGPCLAVRTKGKDKKEEKKRRKKSEESDRKACNCKPSKTGCPHDTELCPHGNFIRDQRCPYLLLREEAMRAQIVITNYDITIFNGLHKDLVIGKFDAIILDEAHEFPEKLRDHLTQELSLARFYQALEKLGELYNGPDESIRPMAKPVIDELADALDDFVQQIVWYTREHAEVPLKGQPEEVILRKDHGLNIERLESAVVKAAEMGKTMGDKPDDEEESAVSDARIPLKNLQRLLLHHPYWVSWIEHQDGKIKLWKSPVELEPYLKQFIHERTRCVVAVSATLCPSGTWEYPLRELAMPPGTLTGRAETPFDYSKQAIWFIPSGMPWPTSKDGKRRDLYNRKASEMARALVQRVGGRTLILCSALKDVPVAAKAIEGLGYEVLVQGRMPPKEIERRFRENPSSCLVASKMFGTGFDIQGDALECVILWKLPYSSITVADLQLQTNLNKERWNDEHYEPRMWLQLRQWIGRLIRSDRDRGVIAILDGRVGPRGPLHRKALRAIPASIRKTESVDEVSEFLAQARAA